MILSYEIVNCKLIIRYVTIDYSLSVTVIQRVMVPLNISMVTQNGTTNSYSHNYDTYMNLEPGSEVEAENGTPFNSRNETSINFGPGSAIDGDDETFSATNYACGEDIQFLWYKVEFKRLLAVDEVHITVALLEKFLTKMNETLKIAVLRGSNEYSCGTVTYWFQQDRLSFNVTCNGLVGEGVIARKVHNNKNITMCEYLAIAEIAVYETFRDGKATFRKFNYEDMKFFRLEKGRLVMKYNFLNYIHYNQKTV